MALYISVARRRRAAFALAFATLVIGLAIGFATGRHGAPSVASRVASVRSTFRAVAARLDNVPGEYTKAIAGKQALKSGVLDTLDTLRKDAQSGLERAPWIPQKQRDSLLDGFAKARSDAVAKTGAAVFTADVTALGADLRAL